jgi:hypothetical protein
VWEVDGTPVSVGREQRIVPDRTRRLVEDRDRGCVFPGCQATRFLEVHHLDHWADGGATDLDRLVCLCPLHHDAHHRGEFTITGCPIHPERLVQRTAEASAGLLFTNARGRVIGTPDRPVAARLRPREPVVEACRGPTGERLHGRWLDLPANRPALTVVPDIPPPGGAGPPGDP